MPVEAEIERVGAGLHPGEVAVEVGDAVLRVEAHRLDQVEAPARRHKRSLRQAFAPFVAGLAVGDDAGAEADPGDPLARLQHQRPDRDIERGFAVRRKPADRAAIDGPRGAASSAAMISIARILGAPVIEPQGIDGLEEVDRAEAVLQLGGDGRGQLEQGRIGLDREQFGHRDAAGPGDAREVVAQQIDDHQILGALLGVGAERLRVGVARRGALHRPGGDAARSSA